MPHLCGTRACGHAGMRQCGACITAPPPVYQALAAVAYGYPWAGLIAQFKF
jgi:predicted amidophosphoribosyltransferase